MPSQSKYAKCVFVFTTTLMLLTGVAFGQVNASIPVGYGTFHYTVEYINQGGLCHWSNHKIAVGRTLFDKFSYTDPSGANTSIPGSLTIIYTQQNGIPAQCNTGYTHGVQLPSTYYTVNFTGSLDGSASGTISYAYTGILYPKYQIQSIIYSTPGNMSSNGFTNSTTDGTTTSVGSSFQAGDTTTFSVSEGFLGLGSTLSWSYGNSATTGNSTEVTNTISQATGISNASNSSSPNAINHKQDLFIIWLNPAVTVAQTGATSAGYATGTQLLSSGAPEIQDQVEVFAQSMMANAQGATTVPVAILVPQIVDGQSLPGLANICAHVISGYPASCTQANQCGCVPSDFTAILNADPLLNYTSTQNPLNADTSGATACTNPTSSAKCRYVPVMVSKGSSVQITELLAGPQTPGGNIPVNTFNQTDSTQATQTYSESFATTLGFSWEQMWKPLGTGLSLKSDTEFTWTNNESTGAINGTANSMDVTLSSSTVDCNQEIPIFEDTVYHTFVFQQPSGNNSCP